MVLWCDIVRDVGGSLSYSLNWIFVHTMLLNALEEVKKVGFWICS
ncbi:unnamed protein product [Coffea canephora]|uniref:Uncharacterized protein n=1 Tax=Coffea canephora TaxID=49390 RepID=A0A068UB29_COFCA|nr:unnamed protein product [Coffea canephora]